MTQPGAPVATKPTKAIVAAIGATLTAFTTALASVNVALADNTLDASDYGSLALAGAVLLSTVYAVWRVPNRPVSS